MPGPSASFPTWFRHRERQRCLRTGLPCSRGQRLPPGAGPALQGSAGARLEPVWRNLDFKMVKSLLSGHTERGCLGGDSSTWFFSAPCLGLQCKDGGVGSAGGTKTLSGGFPGGAVVENPPANAGDTGSIPGPGRPHMPQSN